MSNNDNGNSNSSSGNSTAENIITIIGVPLAVLGVLPILYNTLATLAALSKIKRMLRHGKLTALTRSDVVNRVIEVELPRYAVQPWDRFDQRGAYWQVSRQPSAIPGGSWTTFNWKTNTIGIKTQRVEYADQLRQPQVEVEFQELVAYLLDLGALPDPHGWRLLRSTGLWTPMGCALMKSPDRSHVALAIAPLDDSDGHLSLKVTWEPSWTTRDASKLPPYWVSLPPPPPPPKKESEEEGEGEGEDSAAASSSQEAAQSPEETDDASKAKEEKSDKLKGEGSPKQSEDSIQKQGERNATLPITCQFSADGLQSALSQEPGSGSGSAWSGGYEVQSLHMEHLRQSGAHTAGKWFASAATAYGTTSQTVLWNYRIPDEVLAFARRDTVPCGVLELLGVVDGSLTPQWETTSAGGTAMEDHESFVRAMQEQRIAMAAEARMDPAARQIAVRQRTEREMMQRMNDMRDRSRRDALRRETRRLEALQSPKWDAALVAEHNLRWLRAREGTTSTTTTTTSSSSSATTPTPLPLRDVVGTLLHRMVLDGAFARGLCEVLDAWKAWADNGGMRAADFDLLAARQELFAQASLLVALVRDAAAGAGPGGSAAHEGSLSMDLQECLRMWRVVRLG